MNLCNIGHSFNYELEKLIRIFLPFEKIRFCNSVIPDVRFAVAELEPADSGWRLFCSLDID